MAPEPSMKNPEGFLNEENSISIENLPILKECDALTIYDIDAKPFARGKFAQVKSARRKKSLPASFGEHSLNSLNSLTHLNNSNGNKEIIPNGNQTLSIPNHQISNGNKETTPPTSYAAKFIKKRRRCQDVTHEILHEIRVLFMSRNHDRIIQLYNVYESAHEYILILELASGGDLQRVLDGEDYLSEIVSIKFMRQILEGVAYLHSINIAHLDIKPQNILLDAPYPSTQKVKLCDFGISRLITDGVELREIVGTPDYVAPEVLHYEPISLSTDLWSIGCLTYVLLTGYSPFGADNKQETFCNITNGSLEFPPHMFENISSSAVDFIKKLLVKDPKKRMSCEECLQHEWTTDQLIALKKQEALNSPPSVSPTPSSVLRASDKEAILVSEKMISEKLLLDKDGTNGATTNGNNSNQRSADSKLIQSADNNNFSAIDEHQNNQINLSK